MAKKILIVEDYPDTSQMIADILDGEKYEFVFAADGAAGVEKAIAEKPDLILLDIMMPQVGGYEACKKIKANPATKDIPVIFLSVLRNEAEQKKGLAVGADAFITKPFDPEQLLKVIKDLL